MALALGTLAEFILFMYHLYIITILISFGILSSCVQGLVEWKGDVVPLMVVSNSDAH